jgi:NitT/TauT family transport system ATP-binding protein
MVSGSGPARTGRIGTYNDPASTARPRRVTRAESDAAAPVSTDTAGDGNSSRATAAIQLRELAHEYSTDSGVVHALAAVDLDVAAGEFVSIVGPSGCGKTTMLRAVAGLLEPSTGSLSVLGGSPREARQQHAIGLITQEAGLMPWLTVAANVRMSPQLAGRPDAVDDWLRRVGVDRFAGLYPRELSGGMKQRVALARALAHAPRLLLMDEPFGALDELSREALRLELLEIWERERSSVLFVTHSIREALLLSDRVAVMSGSPGRIIEDLRVPFDRPRSDSLFHDRDFLTLEQRIRALLREAG